MDSESIVCLFGFSADELEPFAGKRVVLFTKEDPFDVYFDGVSCDLASFAQICKQEIFQKFSYLLHPSFEAEDKKQAEEWIRRAQMTEWYVQLSFCEYEDFRLTIYNNLMASLDQSVDRSSFESMRGILQDVPAFICGAGPSLKESACHLAGNRGVVFAGGAALSYLDVVHIAAGVDPSPCHARVRMSVKGVPFFYQSRFDASLLSKMDGPKFQVASNPGYPLEHWLEEKEPFDGGWTVTTFCTALALHMGCNPIIFVGMDLAYGSDGSIYTQGMKEQEVGKGILWQDNIQTQKDWVLAARWIEEKVAEYPGRTFYTTSQEGMKLQGVNSVSLKELSLPEADFLSYLEAIKERFYPISADEKKATELRSSIEGSLEKVEKLLSLWETYYPTDPKGKGEFILEVVELEEQIAYRLILEPLWQVWQYPLQREGYRKGTEGIQQLLFFKKVLQEYKKRVPCKSA